MIWSWWHYRHTQCFEIWRKIAILGNHTVCLRGSKISIERVLTFFFSNRSNYYQVYCTIFQIFLTHCAFNPLGSGYSMTMFNAVYYAQRSHSTTTQYINVWKGSDFHCRFFSVWTSSFVMWLKYQKHQLKSVWRTHNSKYYLWCSVRVYCILCNLQRNVMADGGWQIYYECFFKKRIKYFYFLTYNCRFRDCFNKQLVIIYQGLQKDYLTEFE